MSVPVCRYVLVCPKCPPSLGVIAAGAWHSLPQIYVMYVLVGIVVFARNPMGTLLYVACCHAEDLGYACCVPNLTAVVDVAVCGCVDGMTCCCVRNLHQWLTVASLHPMLCYNYVGADHAGPLTRKLWGSGPCGITKPLFHSRWKPI